MASRGRRSETQSHEPKKLDRSTLAGALQYALARLVVLERGPKATARLLGLDPAVVRRWVSRGVPAEDLSDPVAVSNLLTIVAAHLARWDETEPKRNQRKARLAYSGLIDSTELEPGDNPEILRPATLEQQQAAAARLKVLGSKLAQDARKVFGRSKLGKPEKISRVALLAEELGVPLKRVRRWLAEGRVAGPGLYKVDVYERQVKSTKLESRTEKRRFKELLALGRRKVKKVEIREKRDRAGKVKQYEVVVEEPQVPRFRRSEGYFGGDGTSGWRLGIPVHDFLSKLLLERIVRLARDTPFQVPKGFKGFKRFDEWRITAVVSVLYAATRKEARRVKSAAGYYYGKNVRNDLSASHPGVGNRFVVSDAYSSGGQGTRKEAVKEFKKRLEEELGDDLVYVHGVVVWNYRRRTAAELELRMEARRVEREAKERAGERAALAKEKRAKRAKRVSTRNALLSLRADKKGKKR